jgi:tRNA pseudouridine(55) synthase
MLTGRIQQVIIRDGNCPKEGIFAIYKDEGISSHDVVNVVRKYTGENRVGHAGTLDPYAKGVLVIGVGRAATRELGEVVKKDRNTSSASSSAGAALQMIGRDGSSK